MQGNISAGEKVEDKRIDSLVDRIWANEIDPDKVYNLVACGSNKLSHNMLIEKLVLDDQWIGQMEYGLKSVENIIRNPKKSILEDAIIVPVEKSKKVNERSIRHLTMHSENVKSIDGDEVKPKSVLTPIIEDELAIYENRFIYCLIERAHQFIEKRYKTIERHMRVSAHENLNVKTKFSIDGARVDCEVNLNIKEKPDNIDNAKNLKLVARVGDIRRRLAIIKKSQFCFLLRKSKPVYPPIVKTNILTKNVDYNNAYRLWIFLSGYDQDGFSINVKNKNYGFDDDYASDLLAITSLVPATLFANNEARKEQYENKELNELMNKHYKVINDIQYKPTFNLPEVKADEGAINQYYYDKMRTLLGKQTGLKSGTVVQKKHFVMEFAKFYSTVTKISDEMYYEIIEVQDETSSNKKLDKIALKQAELARQEEKLRRHKILTRLKESELSKTIKREIAERMKVEVLRFELEVLENKRQAKDIQSKIAADQAKKEEERLELMQMKLESLDRSLDEEERAKCRKRLEDAGNSIKAERERRERELLELLKRKYEDE